MSPSFQVRQLAQRILRDHVEPTLDPDGWFGSASMVAAAKWVPWSFEGKPTAARWVAAVIQKAGLLAGFAVGKHDAYYGSQTSDVADRLFRLRNNIPPGTRPDESDDSVGNRGGSTIKCWSPSTAQFNARYGPVGQNQGLAKSPYLLRLDWDLRTTITKFSAHQDLVPRIEKALADTLDHYGQAEITKLGLDRFGGCLNVRPKRGGSTPSVHSWGAAIDWFPSKNQLKQSHKTALFARESYKAFLQIWEAQGFMSLGRCFDFDWMHKQANP